MALYFHLSTAILSGFPLACSWPQAAAPISWFDGLMLVGVAAGSFLGQLFMTRSLQLENASLISSLNFSQVGSSQESVVVGQFVDGRAAGAAIGQ